VAEFIYYLFKSFLPPLNNSEVIFVQCLGLKRVEKDEL